MAVVAVFSFLLTNDLLFMSDVIRLEIDTFRFPAQKNVCFARVCKEARGEKGPK